MSNEQIIKVLEEVLNELGGPVTSYAPEIAMKEFGEKIKRGACKLIELRAALKRAGLIF